MLTPDKNERWWQQNRQNRRVEGWRIVLEAYRVRGGWSFVPVWLSGGVLTMTHAFIVILKKTSRLHKLDSRGLANVLAGNSRLGTTPIILCGIGRIVRDGDYVLLTCV